MKIKVNGRDFIVEKSLIKCHHCNHNIEISKEYVFYSSNFGAWTLCPECGKIIPISGYFEDIENLSIKELLDKELTYKGYYGCKKHYTLLDFNIFIDFDDTNIAKPYIGNVETGIGANRFFFSHFASEEELFKSCALSVKELYKETKQKEEALKLQKTLKTQFEKNKNKWEKEYQESLKSNKTVE